MGTLPQAFFSPEKKAPYFWKPLTCGYVAAGAFFPTKRAPYFWKPLDCGYVAAGTFFSTKKGPIFLEALLSRRALIHQICALIMRARHGNIWHGTDPPDHGTARDIPEVGVA